MKSQKQGEAHEDQPSFALVANGAAGAWEVAVDETTSGAHQWFAQIDGPACYLYLQIRNPSVISEMLDFLRSRLWSRSGALSVSGFRSGPKSRSVSESRSAKGSREFELSHLDAVAVTLTWDNRTNDRCHILVAGKGEFRVRLCIERNDLEQIVEALQQVEKDLAQARNPLPPAEAAAP